MFGAPPGHDGLRRAQSRSLWRLAFMQIALGALSAIMLTSCQFPGVGSASSTVNRPTPTETPSFGAELRSRPLHLPTLAAGASCPKTPAQNPDYGLGDGPVYAYGGGVQETGVINYAPPKNFGSDEWGGQLVSWRVRPEYQGGIVLIRGRQLDGSNEVRFGRGNVPNNELVFRVEPSATAGDGWFYEGDYLRFRAPDCYGMQIDTSVASEVIVFQAVAQAI
jgi:hypothetical protein